MSEQIKFVNMHVVPMPRVIKREPDVEEDEDEIPCSMCSKEFASQVAVRNHMRNEHTDAFVKMTVNIQPDEIKQEPGSSKHVIVPKVHPPRVPPVHPPRVPPVHPPRVPPVKLKGIKAGMNTIVVKSGPTHKMKEELDKKIKEREQALLESMRPGRIQDVVSKDVKYIIVKSEKEIIKTKKKHPDLEQTNESEETAKKRRKIADEKDGKPSRERERERGEQKKEPNPISGPFECLQPSTLVSSGSCHQIFFSCCEYSRHYRDEHSKRRKTNANRCQVCEKPLNGGDVMDTPFTCQVCGAGFMSFSDLGNHTALEHVKLKPYQCNICQKRFTQQGGLQQHMRMHSGIRPYTCTYCPKAFTQKSGLDQHLRIHTKEKPYHCIVCGKSFIQAVHLKQHMRTHTNVAPFQCAICQKRFKQSSHLNYHLKNHNAFLMTDEQKVKYAELMDEINASEARAALVGLRKDNTELRRRPKKKPEGSDEKAAYEKVVVMTEGDDEVMVLQYAEDYVTDSAAADDEVVEETTVEQAISDQEQLLAEQSIQIEGETYHMGDDESVTYQAEAGDDVGETVEDEGETYQAGETEEDGGETEEDAGETEEDEGETYQVGDTEEDEVEEEGEMWEENEDDDPSD